MKVIGGKKPAIFFQLAERNVQRNLLRSLLATLGIVIGVVAITAMGMLGVNMQLSVTASLEGSANIISISPESGGGGFGPGGDTGSANTFISEDQVRGIRQVAGQNTVVPLYMTSDKITVGSGVIHPGTQTNRASIIGMTPSDIPLFAQVADGSMLRSGSSNDALVGATLAQNDNLIVGNRIQIGDITNGGSQTTVRVAGILASSGPSIGLNPDRAIIVSNNFYTSFYGGQGQYDQVNIIVDSISDIGPVENATDAKFNAKTQTFRITDSGSLLSRISSTLTQITMFITLLGGISLIVAAVSIFNVMMMSVKDRIGEIGILRSIGTTRGEVRRIFVYEATVLGGLGALVGGVMSFIGGYLAVGLMLGNTDYFFEPASLIYVPYGMGIGMAVCVLSGLYPAWKASNLNPIEALRSE
jgi:putative ABC transport system permease protein